MVIKLIKKELGEDEVDRPEVFIHPERFHSFKFIGGGSFGRVMSAKDKVKENRSVAIKKISLQTQKPRLSDVKNVLREVVILRYAKNPQIVELITIYMELRNETVKVPVSIYIVMNYCGVNLVDYMANRNGLISLEQAAQIVYNVACGLNFLHKLEVYHRDLKPNNICISDNSIYHAKIIDLGYARKKPHESKEITSRLATVCYRAPENLFGLKYKEKQDVWSLGCILGYIASFKNIFRYMKREYKESSGTLMLIIQHLGKPSQNYMENLDRNRADIDMLLWRDFNKMVENCDAGKGFSEFLERYEITNPKREEALDLLKGMLKWHHEDRMSIQDIIESDFVADCRNEICETLPDAELCDMIKSILEENENEIREYEIKKDYNGLIQDYLYEHIAKDFGYDEDVQDYYPYSSSSE